MLHSVTHNVLSLSLSYKYLLKGLVWLLFAVSGILSALFWLMSARLPKVKQLSSVAAGFAGSTFLFSFISTDEHLYKIIGTISGSFIFLMSFSALFIESFYKKIFTEPDSRCGLTAWVIRFFRIYNNHIYKTVNEDFYDLLDSRKMLIVHFSGLAETHRKVPFPKDLQGVLKNAGKWTLSCSALTPGKMISPTGEIGVVLKPWSLNSVLSVNHEDSGSYIANGVEKSLGKPLTLESFEESINCVVPGTYNEWRIKGAKTDGIFVASPSAIQVRCEQTLDCDGAPIKTNGICYPSLDDIKKYFPNERIWTMDESGPKLLYNPPAPKLS